jgi:hypothetical protein
MQRSGFFPYVDGDVNSQYDDAFLAKFVSSFISTGVYNGDLAVTAGANMQIVLPPGQAWINGYYYRNDSNLAMPIANADGLLKRKDTVVLRWDINTRNITVQVLTGAFASSPVAPAIVRTAEQYDLKIAEIYIAAGTTAITQAMITDTRLDKTVCGVVTGVITQVDTTTLYNQIQSDLAGFKNVNEADFTAWVNGLKAVLGAETAGNLLNLINAHKADTIAHTAKAQQDAIASAVQSATIGGTAVPKSGTTLQFPYPTPAQIGIDKQIVYTAAHSKSGTVHTITGAFPTSSHVVCRFYTAAAYNAGDTFSVSGTTYSAILGDGSVSIPAEFFASGVWIICTIDTANHYIHFLSFKGNAALLNGVPISSLMQIVNGGNKKQDGLGSISIITAGASIHSHITFPTAFASAPLVIAGLTSLGTRADYFAYVMAANVTTTGFDIYANSQISGEIDFTWCAIGG